MPTSDSVANVLTIIRNATARTKEKVDLPSSRFTHAILEVLKREGFIQDFRAVRQGPGAMTRVYLKLGPHREPAITGLRRISTPSLRVYVGALRIPKVLGGLGVALVSTSRGLLTDEECRAQRVGGEVVCYVW